MGRKPLIREKIDQIINVGDFNLSYNDPSDFIGIVECYVLDVYNINNIKPGDIVVDIGAGIGDFAVLSSGKTGKKGKVLAIEPSPEDYNTMLENLKKNRCENVVPVNMAVSENRSDISIEFKGKKFSAKADTLSNIISDAGFTDQINFVKMDNEGYEKVIIEKSESTIRGIDYLALEIHYGQTDEIVARMKRLGFTFKRISRRKYLLSTLSFALGHPRQSYNLLRVIKAAGYYPGIGKVTRGIKISSSEELVVGTFRRTGNENTLGFTP